MSGKVIMGLPLSVSCAILTKGKIRGENYGWRKYGCRGNDDDRAS